MRIKNIILFIIIICIGFSYLYSQDIEESPELAVLEEKSLPIWGFIFNTSNLLLDIESCQAGVGIKILRANNAALRFLWDVFYSNSPNTFPSTPGATYE